jgi:hypothetical protein
MKRVFITEYVGLSTRLETLAMAFMNSDYYGHEVCIDWKDADAHGRGAHDWYATCRADEGLVPVADAATLPITAGASVDWMRGR